MFFPLSPDIQGITEEILYEKSLLTEFEKESTSRLDICNVFICRFENEEYLFLFVN